MLTTIYSLVLIQISTRMVSKRKKKKSSEKKQLSLSRETSNDFIVGNGTNVSAMENETLEQQTNGQDNDFERFVDSTSQNQVIESNIDNKIKRVVENTVTTVENRMLDAILAAMDKILIRRVEMAVRSITSPSGHGPNSEVQNPD